MCFKVCCSQMSSDEMEKPSNGPDQWTCEEGNIKETIGQLAETPFIKTPGQSAEPAIVGKNEAMESVNDEDAAPTVPPALEGGWGWVIVFACFLMHFLVGGWNR